MRLMMIAGARPNFMKVAPVMKACKSRRDIEPILVHTGQHYDENMSSLFFSQLGLPEPDMNLGVGSASQAVQTADIMKAFEPVALARKPDAVLVVGDVNSTIACGLVAVKLGIPLIHVEAGLRSFDRSMPEEVNRVLTDAISDLLFCTEQSGVDNLLKEGISQEKIILAGNVMIDTLLSHQDAAEGSDILKRLGLDGKDFALLTLHRPSNVDDPGIFGGILDALAAIEKGSPIVFPIHPRTRQKLAGFKLDDRIKAMPNLRLLDPLGYLDFLKLMSRARVVLTDSGGIQEETTILGVPCLTLRENTERPVTVESGMNKIVGTDPAKILAAYRLASGNSRPAPRMPPLWDGHAAERIVGILADRFLLPAQ
jgi:UDP-N-acetylglucosamine 2-epimerase (non-hydrolysing)